MSDQKIKKPVLSKRIELRQIPKNEIVIMKHKWRDLLFLHWKYNADEIQKTLPEGLFVDTFNEQAYLGITPFFLHDVRPVFLPSISVLSNFLEVNVRTYVHDKEGTPGVWFYSLDANQPLAVKIARQIFLPYQHAKINAVKALGSGEIIFNVKRKNVKDELSSEFRYQKNGDEFFPDSESLEFFLIERYLLFSYDAPLKKLYTIRVYHKPYPLKNAGLLKWDDHLLTLNNFNVNNSPPDHIIMSEGVDVDIFKMRRLNF